MCGIDVTSRRIAGSEGAVYVGRGRNSPLGNPYKLESGEEGGATLERYKRWLWQEMGKQGKVWEALCNIAARVAGGEQVVLACWCVKELNGDQPCHAYVVRDAVLWMVAQREEALAATTPVERPRNSKGQFTKAS